ncbi:MAG TPA: response regulator [Methanomassiliicoccales archaeon]|jgi:two-component system, chemotaxis family, chemotaxis protein CheY
MSDPKKVLICDDSIVMRKMINDILSRNGFSVVGQAKNGAEAVELYSKLQPDLVTMDIIMPGEPGVEIVKKIVTLDSKARIMMVTGLSQKNLVLQAMENGAREFVVKPFDESALLEAAAKTIG